tara:strand:+ start:1298 stop:1627 length:330 start_codon:yes stop_codon:yes gene_type:complete
MDFNKISNEDLHRVLIIIEKQRNHNIELVNKLEDMLKNKGYDLQEIDFLILNEDSSLSEEDVLLYDLVNALRFNNTLLYGSEPLLEKLSMLNEEDFKNKINKELGLDLN